MASTFPGAIDTFTTKVNGVDTPDAAHINDLQNAVLAIENELGVNMRAKGEIVINGTLYKSMQLGIGQTGFMPSGTLPCATRAVYATANYAEIDYLAFDSVTTEAASMSFIMPPDFTGEAVMARICWFHPPTTVNFGVYLRIMALAYGDDESFAGALGTLYNGIDTGGVAEKMYITPLSTPTVIPGLPAANCMVSLRLQRFPSLTEDTLAVDCHVAGVMLYYPVA